MRQQTALKHVLLGFAKRGLGIASPAVSQPTTHQIAIVVAVAVVVAAEAVAVVVAAEAAEAADCVEASLPAPPGPPGEEGARVGCPVHPQPSPHSSRDGAGKGSIGDSAPLTSAGFM